MRSKKTSLTRLLKPRSRLEKLTLEIDSADLEMKLGASNLLKFKTAKLTR